MPLSETDQFWLIILYCMGRANVNPDYSNSICGIHTYSMYTLTQFWLSGAMWYSVDTRFAFKGY